jgi:tRNA/tmRNA/rRNA uracil-C5-methylase (TrmA/RlmC/RlmD family)
MQFKKNPYDFTYLDTIQYVAGDRITIRGPAPLASLSYASELELKQKGFEEFIKRTNISGDYCPIIPSPFKRYYRTTTKRRVVFAHGVIQFRMNESSGDFPDQDQDESLCEPKQHGDLYTFLLNLLNEPLFMGVGKRCNYVIIRGSYKEFCVIFNMHQLDGTVVRRLKSIGEQLLKQPVPVISSFVVHDPTRSRYYLDRSFAGERFLVKKLFGPETLRFSVDDLTWLYDPTSFSQINQSIVPLMLKKAAGLLNVTDPVCKSMRFLDLYCGYGLFTMYLGRHFNEVFGIESESSAIHRAQASIAHCKDFTKHIKVRMIPGQITAHVLETVLPVAEDKEEIVVLDPPRSGAEKGVIGALAFRKPQKVLHVFCNADLLQSELDQWNKLGYKTSSIVPLDMFPGTAHLEIMVLLEKTAMVGKVRRQEPVKYRYMNEE